MEILVNMISKIVLCFFFLFLFFNFDLYAQNDELEKYELKFHALDSSKYISKSLIVERYLNGNIKFLAIGVSQIINEEKESFFLDSAKTFHRNGIIKKVQMLPSSGDAFYCKFYNEEGKLTRHCTEIVDDPDTEETESNYCLFYSDGKLLEEGAYILKKKKLLKHGPHIIYNNPLEPNTVVYYRGKEQNVK